MATDKPYRKGRTLILLFDGTANEFDDTNTNVVKLAGVLKKKDPSQQMVYYQTGVGTGVSTTIVRSLINNVQKIIDLGVALYLDQHVMDGYRFIQDNHHKGDRICIFGFSRGSYTARAVAGMLSTIGLLPPDMPEQVPFAYSIFKQDTPRTRLTSAAYKRTFCRNVHIEFLGVWDTVSSVGALYPRILPFSASNHMTRCFRHAIALDEHRARFRSNTWHRSIDPDAPVLEAEISVGFWRTIYMVIITVLTFGLAFSRKWDSGLTETLAQRKRKSEIEIARWNAISPREKTKEGNEMKKNPTDVKEVWFAGAHCDVGGGNVMDGEKYALSNIPLRWMIKEAIECNAGILFRKPELAKMGIFIEKKEKELKASKEEADPWIDNAPATNGHANGSVLPNGVPNGHANGDTATPQKSKSDDLIGAITNGDKKKKKEMQKKAEESKDPYPDDVQYSVRLVNYKSDIIQPIRDPLFTWNRPISFFPFTIVDPSWWLLEFLPAVDSVQQRDYHWKNVIRFNLFRPRDIPFRPYQHRPFGEKQLDEREARISSAPALFHVSVRDRMKAPQAATRSWKSFWTRKEMYRPLAWPKEGDPEYVE